MNLHLLTEWVLFASLLAMSIGVARLFNDWLHPAPVLAMLWTLVCGAYLGMQHGMRSISPETFLLVTVAVAAFCAGAGLTRISPARTPALARQGEWQTTALRPLLFWLSLLGMPLFLLKAAGLAENADYTESFYINLRIALTGELDDAQTFGVLAYLIPISFASALVELASSRRRWFEPRGWVSLAWAAGYAVMATGRTYVFLLVIAIAAVSFIQKRASARQIALGTLIVFGLAFFGLGMLANKIGVDIVNKDAYAGADALALYLLGSLAAFDVTVLQAPALEWGANILRSPLAVLSALGLPVQVPPLVKAYVYVPEPTNVYTVFLPYFLDFGWIGVIASFTLFGWAHSAMYERAKRTLDPRWVIATALSMYPLLMQFFQDQYVSLLTTWITFALLIGPCFKRQP